jgi:peptidoglycan/xylan/chitin deacetylase (PgdA/CDA1 family)
MFKMIPYLLTGPFILMYHSISDDSKDPFSVSVHSFREQVSWLYRNGFEVVSLEFLVSLIKENDYKSLNKKVVFTFDDGCKDFIINALPVLLDYRAPATVFIVTDMLGGETSWNKSGTRVPIMSEDEVRYIKEQGISLGSHTATHANLVDLGNDAVYRQLQDSYQKLLDLGESFSAFSYPWGQFSTHTVQVVREIGYQCAVVAGKKKLLDNFDIHLLPRFAMTRDLNLKSFQDIVSHTNLTRTLIRYGRFLKRRFHNSR